MHTRSLLAAAAGLVLLAGCSAGPVSPSGPAVRPSVNASAPTAEPLAGDTADRWADGQINGPFTVRGLVVVSKDYPVSSAYVPPWAGQPDGLHPDVHAAFDRLVAGAAADGLTVRLRSAYRSYAAQQASFSNALATYDEATARRYFAEAGKSEHQTGLSLDAWDGVNRGTAFARTAQARWLAEHAWEYGFIIRYPEGRTDVTGYAWESWHLRWVGEDVARAFGPNSTLTLEEYLGLA